MRIGGADRRCEIRATATADGGGRTLTNRYELPAYGK
jgi:hypothetical protein